MERFNKVLIHRDLRKFREIRGSFWRVLGFFWEDSRRMGIFEGFFREMRRGVGWDSGGNGYGFIRIYSFGNLPRGASTILNDRPSWGSEKADRRRVSQSYSRLTVADRWEWFVFPGHYTRSQPPFLS